MDVRRANLGIKKGDGLAVVRNGRRVALIQITSPYRFHSFAKPLDDEQRTDIRVGDDVVFGNRR